MKTVNEPARVLPVVCEADLCVVGGSCTGVFAAVRAARLGLSVAIVEKHNCFGGVAANAMVNIWHSLHDTEEKIQIIGGLTVEVLERLEKQNALMMGDQTYNRYQMQTEELKIELDALVSEHGVVPFLHTAYCGVLTEGDRVTHVIIENKNGRQAIAARFVIDASGDGDVCRDLGMKAFYGPHVQPPTPCYKLLGAEGVNISSLLQQHASEVGLPPDWGWASPIPGMPGVWMRADTHVFNTDCSEASQLTRAEIEGRRQIRGIETLLRRYYPDVPFSLVALPSNIGIRETRHYETDYHLTEADLLSGRDLPDAVAYGTYRVDVHSDEVGIVFRYLDGTQEWHKDRVNPPTYSRWRPKTAQAPTYYQIPFRVMVQDRVKNFLMAGRMINADEGAFGAVRVMVNLNQLGEAAGVAAALCLRDDVVPDTLDPALLRQTLANGGSIML